jgi:hypothetical protein
MDKSYFTEEEWYNKGFQSLSEIIVNNIYKPRESYLNVCYDFIYTSNSVDKADIQRYKDYIHESWDNFNDFKKKAYDEIPIENLKAFNKLIGSSTDILISHDTLKRYFDIKPDYNIEKGLLEVWCYFNNYEVASIKYSRWLKRNGQRPLLFNLKKIK